MLLFVALLLASVSQALAGPRSFSQARKIAEAQAARLGITIDSKSAARARQMNGADNQAVRIVDYYVFPNGSDRGFTIVSGDDRMPAIVGYADHGTYDEDNMPKAMAAFLASYRATVEAVKRGDSDALRNMAEAEALRADSSAHVAAAVSPLLGDIKWNQLDPYNQMCPKYDGTNRSATGCVATAMAQVMAYWKYPDALQADIPAYTTGGSTTTDGTTVDVPGISKGERYDWDNMLPRYTSGYTQAQADAVAKLMYHCGAAVKMDYGPQSGAYVTPAALAKYFGYDADLMMEVRRSTLTLAQWTAAIDQELAAGRPVLYGGQSSDGGHQFVCDGSDGDGLYHINWGWGGSQDGYFDITILNPAKGGVGSGNAADGFNMGCSMIIGMQPDNGKVDQPLVDIPSVVAYDYTYNKYTTGLTVTKGTRQNDAGKFGLTLVQWWGNQVGSKLTAKVAFGISDGNGGYTLIADPENLTMDAANEYGMSTLYGTSSDVSYAFKTGTYSIYALYSTDGGTTWHKSAYYNSRPYVINVTSTTLTQQGAQLTATVTTDDTQYSGQKGTFHLNVTNNGDDEYLGEIYLYTSTDATMPDDETASVYITVPAHSTVTRDVEFAPTGEGQFYVWATDEDDRVLVDAAQFTAEKSTAPSFTLNEVKSNATPNDYETEKAYYNSYQVEAPRVNDDYAEFTYYIKNDGGTCTRTCYLYAYNMETLRGMRYARNIKFAGDGAITEITYQVKPEQVNDGRSMMSHIEICKDDPSDGTETLSTTLPNNNLYIVDGSGYIPLGPQNMFVYVAGKPTSVAGIDYVRTPSVRGGVGEIVVVADKAHTVDVCHVDGRRVATVGVEAGGTVRIPVQPGVYVVDGHKVVVR